MKHTKLSKPNRAVDLDRGNEGCRFSVVMREPDFEDPGAPVRVEARRLVAARHEGITYLNPAICVSTESLSLRLFSEIDRGQRVWFRLLSRELKNGWRRDLRYISGEEADYKYYGVVLFGTTILGHDRWRALKRCSELETRPEASHAH